MVTLFRLTRDTCKFLYRAMQQKFKIILAKKFHSCLYKLCTDLHKYIYTDKSLNWLMFLLKHYCLVLQEHLSAAVAMRETR